MTTAEAIAVLERAPLRSGCRVMAHCDRPDPDSLPGGADDSDPYDSYDEFFDTWKEET